MIILPAQIRAARALLGWKQTDLAERSGVSGISIKNIERGFTDPRVSTLNAIIRAFETAGIEFTNGGQPGVKLRAGHQSQGSPEPGDVVTAEPAEPASLWPMPDDLEQALSGEQLGGEQQPMPQRSQKSASKATDMAGREIDKRGDTSATNEERQSRKRRLLKGPKEFRDIREQALGDGPKRKK
jgi:transcriptional regulator with XRE-family HTH domain